MKRETRNSKLETGGMPLAVVGQGGFAAGLYGDAGFLEAFTGTPGYLRGAGAAYEKQGARSKKQEDLRAIVDGASPAGLATMLAMGEEEKLETRNSKLETAGMPRGPGDVDSVRNGGRCTPDERRFPALAAAGEMVICAVAALVVLVLILMAIPVLIGWGFVELLAKPTTSGGHQ